MAQFPRYILQIIMTSLKMMEKKKKDFKPEFANLSPSAPCSQWGVSTQKVWTICSPRDQTLGRDLVGKASQGMCKELVSPGVALCCSQKQELLMLVLLGCSRPSESCEFAINIV